MRNRRWRAQAGPRRSVVAVVGGAVLAGALLLGPWLVLASPEPPPAEVSAPAGSPGASSGGAAVLTLTEALARARASGPGFAAAALQERLRELAEAASAAARGPAVDVSVHTPLTSLSPSLQGTLTWPLTDHLSLQVNAGGSTSGGPASGGSSGLSGGGFGGFVALRYERTLWPPEEEELERAAEALARRQAEVQAWEALLDATRAVMDAFYALRDAVLGVQVAELALDVAQRRAAVAVEHFAAGQIGVSELHAVQRREREALVELRSARQARDDAAVRLARLLEGDGATTGALAQQLLSAELVDDYPWPDLTSAVEELLAGEDELWRRVLENDIAYLHAGQLELEQEAAAREASGGPVRWRFVAEYSAALPGSENSGAGPSAQGLVVLAGTADLSGAGRLRAEQAAVQRELARLRAEQARQAAIDGAQAALLALDDAAFALELTAAALEQAETNLMLVERRLELGFAAPLERAEAELARLQARRDVLRAEANWHLRWLDVARRLGVPLP